MSHFKILKHLVILIVAAAFTAACGEQQAPAPEQGLTEYLEAVTMEQIKESPESISFLGLPEDQIGEKTQDRLDDRSPTADAKAKADFIAVNDQLKNYDRDTLSDDEKLYLDIAMTVSERALPMLDRAGPFSPNFPGVYRITQLSGPHLGIPGLLQAQHPMNSIGDAEDFIARLNEVNRTFAEFIETWSGDLEAGLVPPRFALEKLSATLTQFAEGEATANPLYQIFMARLEGIEDLNDEDKEALLASAEEAITTSVQPGYAAIKAKVDGLIEGAPTDAGVWAQPDGEARYASAVQIFGDTDLSPEQVHQLGLAEVERIVAEIDAIFDSQGITEGTAGERMKTLGENPDMVYPNSDEGRERLLAFLEENLGLVNVKVPEYFSVIPEVGVEIRRVPEFSEATAPGGYYGPPSVDGSRPGIFWINLRDTTEQQLWTLKTLLFHETIPGHHFEIAQAIVATDRPFFRRTFFSSNYSEGWALYAERIAWEMGLYEGDPFGDIGRLQGELWRAVRLVVDTGMHSKKWSREEAIEYMETTLGADHDSVVTEIERYAVWPGQALGYKMGMLKILELRDKARAALGDDFDIKVFHDLILGKGSMPMSVVESRVDAWIAEQTN